MIWQDEKFVYTEKFELFWSAKIFQMLTPRFRVQPHAFAHFVASQNNFLLL